MHTARVRRAALVPVTLLVLALTGCTSNGDSDPADAGGGSAAGETALESERAQEEAAAEALTTSDLVASTRSVIKTAAVSLRAEDVAAARRDVQAVVDRYGGEVEESQTEADEDGEAIYARMVVRVPTESFDEARSDVEQVAAMVASDTTSDDVSTEVIDTDVRVRIERRTINRILRLIERARSISQIVALEQELAQRQADLASLEHRQRHLADQTDMATITVTVERAERGEEPETEDAGFLAGLDAGWDALRGSALVLATVAGALLPWLAVLALLGGPAWVLLRRRAPRTEETAQATE